MVSKEEICCSFRSGVNNRKFVNNFNILNLTMSEMSFIDKINQSRFDTAESIMDFNFKNKRGRILSGPEEVKENSKGILYWMSREFRVQDNWNMLFAQKLAFKNKIPLHVIFFLLPKFLDASVRHYKFLLEGKKNNILLFIFSFTFKCLGLKEVKEELESLNISFHLYPGWPTDHLPKIVKDNNIGAIICDFFPLRFPMKWQDDLKEKFPEDVPLIQVINILMTLNIIPQNILAFQVDGHNIVPCWIASDKQEYAARTIRNKITSKLDTFLTSFPPVIKHPHSGKIDITVSF